MNEQVKYDWMVYVICATYNHASYIKDAMNGFTMQETDFPFVCAIIDDASTHRFWVKDERKFDSTGYEEFEYDKKAIMSSFRSYRGYVFDKRNYWENWTTQPLSCVYRNGDYLKEIPSKAFKY